MENAFKQSSKDGKLYVAEGACPLTPFEVLAIRNRLLSTNQIEDFQLWVLLLVSIKLFLRSGEATGDEKEFDKKMNAYRLE